ncbi:Uncharacterised protein [Helicobacter pametensis]|nr:Uncharacterised protein [Helicobacter pametensis]
MFDLSLSFLLLALLLWLLVRLKQHHHRRRKPLTAHGHDDCSFFTHEYHRDEQ